MPHSRGVQDQVGRGVGQPDLVGEIPAYGGMCVGVELDDL